MNIVYVLQGCVCKQLALASSEHTAQLICVLPYKDGIACVAVSRSGTVRYWSSIAHESSYVEMSTGTSNCVSVIPTKVG